MTDDWVRPTREQVVGWREEGMSWRQIADRLGVSLHVSNAWIKTLGELPANVIGKRSTKGRESEAEIRHLVTDRLFSDRALAAHLGVSVATARRRRVAAGILRGEARPTYSRKTPEEITEIGQLLSEGHSMRAVAIALSVDPYTVARHFPQYRRNGGLK